MDLKLMNLISNSFISSDHHFLHKNIIKYCSRPFDSISCQTKNLIQYHNDIVNKNSTFICLGDFSFHSKKRHLNIIEILKSMNGFPKILIKGNHDKSNKKMISIGFDYVFNYIIYNDILMIHDVHKIINISAEFKFIISGHFHNNVPKYYKYKNYNCINISLDVCEFKPIYINEIVNDFKDIKKWNNVIKVK